MRRRVKGQGSRVKVINLNKKYNLSVLFLKKIVLDILKVLKNLRGAELEFIFLDDAAIKTLNKRYRGNDSATDVLSFLLPRLEFGEERLLGEIFISLDRARHNARVFGTRLEDEITLYTIHGILHLAGYDDETNLRKRFMSKRESQILEHLCKSRNLSKVLTRR